jgi:NTP pyrophosphatase (non-canonical NTP hydrolase)
MENRQIIDLNKKYTTKAGHKIEKLSVEFGVWYVTVCMFKDDKNIGQFTYICDNFGLCIDNSVHNKSNFDLVEIVGYNEGNVDKSFQEKALSSNPGIEKYVDEKINWFSNDVMRKKLIDNAYKGRWDGYSPEWMFEKLIVEVSELFNALIRYNNKNDYKKIIMEAGDINNFALIIADLINERWKNEK